MNGLPEEERLARLRLGRTQGIGARQFSLLISRHGSARAALEGVDWRRRTNQPPPLDAARRERDHLVDRGWHLLLLGDAAYPEPLAQMSDPPPVLIVRGDPGLLSRNIVALVGGRRASTAGRRIAQDLARDLGSAGLVTVSGLARGIDAATHAASLDTGTIAIVGNGVDVVYPPEHARLQAAIGERGAVVSELPVGAQPFARHFPRRNRIIAGLALGVVVVEAALRSGSLITARLALEEGRELFAVPGSPLDERQRGTNDLIRNGAILTETAEDVVSALAPLVAGTSTAARRPKPSPQPELAAEPVGNDRFEPDLLIPAEEEEDSGFSDTARLVNALSRTPVTVDELARHCQLSASAVSALLMDLELEGRIERHPGQRVALAS